MARVGGLGVSVFQAVLSVAFLSLVFLAGYLIGRQQHALNPLSVVPSAQGAVGDGSRSSGGNLQVPAAAGGQQQIVPFDLRRSHVSELVSIEPQPLAPLVHVPGGGTGAQQHHQNRTGDGASLVQADAGAVTEPPQAVKHKKVAQTPPARLCIGVPSAYREQSELLKHMQELVDESRGQSVHIILRQAYSAAQNVDERQALEKMGIEVVTATGDYPELRGDDLKQNFGDAIERVRWRSTHVLDFANTLELCYNYGSPLILMIEDDLKPAKNFVQKLLNEVDKLPDQQFGFITLYSGRAGPPGVREVAPIKSTEDFWYGGPGQHGAVSLLFRREIVGELLAFLRQDYIERPVDWLVPGFIADTKKLRLYEVVPNLFQHMGGVSTFKQNKDRNRMRSPSFRYN
ncbi:hypothetical protein PTSG_07052 [Salpingoeca rosetta]|uniref:Uncharacterized protein n=1 Tax=Salpingoeca rosetta (strain ATCC 50818 / BSB-021) TaxID=946362 RepID=F2UDW9_SALR5|nr:uncharacterized protein PTSG_07052 [Salpingoeca rosetta]EGD74819.1 hypothetical protein PTSG_07052 [Salpingoeca rosetta]|eukprot:XP_004992464.1 hypothetical protein PTSG_07052 [Salpingoeca rosetta]